MTLIDLNGQRTEALVAALGEIAEDAAVLGWHDGGAVIACAAVSRTAAGEVAVRRTASLGDGSEAVDQLIDGIAAVAPGRRLVDGAGRTLRELTAEAAPPDAVRACTLGELEALISASWSRDTSEDPDEWTPENPARGQCGVTAMLVRELLGGEILIANVLRDGVRVERHAWNRLPSGLTLDLTRSQFRRGEQLEAPRVEEPRTPSRTPERYALLAARVRAALRAALAPAEERSTGPARPAAGA